MSIERPQRPEQAELTRALRGIADADTAAVDGLSCGPRQVFHYLANADEYPAALTVAHEIVLQQLRAPRTVNGDRDPRLGSLRKLGTDEVTGYLREQARIGRSRPPPWRSAPAGWIRSSRDHFFTQFLPAALVDGCWLQGMLRVSTAHTDTGARSV